MLKQSFDVFSVLKFQKQVPKLIVRCHQNKEYLIRKFTNSSLTSNRTCNKFLFHRKLYDQNVLNNIKRFTTKKPPKDTPTTTTTDDKSINNESSQLNKNIVVSERQLPGDSKNEPTQIKVYEIKTNKSALSVTTTIEDSKLNDVIFEKVLTPPLPTPSPITLSNSNPTQSENKDKQILEERKKIFTSKRDRLDCTRSSLERNFITPARAMSDFLLKPSDLDSLAKIKRRSPYEQEPPITVYWRKDVERKAIEVWGSRESLLRECLKREIEKKRHQQNIFTVKRRLRDYRREIGYRAVLSDDEPGLMGKSGRVVVLAVAINATNFIFKSFAWLYTGSHSMFAEAIHSLADTLNQLVLAYGINKSTQSADFTHPYGYTNMKYVSCLISGVGIFCIGTGLSIYHGIDGLLHPQPVQDFYWAYFLLGGSLVSEGATLCVAINEIRRAAKIQQTTFKDYVMRAQDPCVNAVLFEDAAAVLSVGVAVTCMGISSITGSPIADALGSLFIGGILGCTASFIIFTNVGALVGRSIPEEHLDNINAELESDVMIRAIHDVKGIDIGNSLVRYKAEIDFDGRQLTRTYLDKQDLNDLLKTVQSFQTIDELESFLLTHGENIVDLMGGEIDRIEMKLRKKFPKIRHCDLEIL